MSADRATRPVRSIPSESRSRVQADRAYDALIAIMDAYGGSGTPEAFFYEVSDAYHTVEAPLYDSLHKGMFVGGEPMWERLLSRVQGDGLAVVDIGAGTGLVGQMLAKYGAARVESLTIVEPNAAMLREARRRAREWPFRSECIQAGIESCRGRDFDVVTVSSVLHHVPDLAGFCSKLAGMVRAGGCLLQMQDPVATRNADEVLAERRSDAAARRGASASTISWRTGRRAIARVARMLGFRRRDPLAHSVNSILLGKGCIRRPMPIEVIWAVTDFHVPEQPFGIGAGISADELTRHLAPLERVDVFTYEFHGLPWTGLTMEEQELERRWWAEGDIHGAVFGSAWLRRS